MMTGYATSADSVRHLSMSSFLTRYELAQRFSFQNHLTRTKSAVRQLAGYARTFDKYVRTSGCEHSNFRGSNVF